MKKRRKEGRRKEGKKITIELKHDDKIHTDEKISFALTENISICGIKILSDKYFPVDSLVKISLTLAKTEKIVNTAGKVRWVNQLSDQLWEIGIEIIDASMDTIKVLIEHLYKEENKSKEELID